MNSDTDASPPARRDGAPRSLLAGIETGGTKVVCALSAVGDPQRIIDTATFPTRDPAATLRDITAFLAEAPEEIASVGIASFGPLDLETSSPTFGHLTSTPKAGWAGVDVLGAVSSVTPNASIRIVSDVTGSAIGEARWGAGSGIDDFAYLTVGTGVGGGFIHNGQPLSGSGWPEIAHVRPRRHPEDRFPGICPFHGDCLEGLVAGPAITARWGTDGSNLTGELAAQNLAFSSYYLGQLVTNLAYTLGTRLALIGGGVAKTPGLLSRVEQEVQRLMGPPGANGTSGRRVVVVPPALGDHAGVLGALSLAESSLE